MKINTTLYKVSSILLFAIVISGATLAYSKAEGNQIQVCVKKSGLIYVIGDEYKRSDCKKNDSFLSWNTAGIQGPKGEKGDKGKDGSSLRIKGPNGEDYGVLIGTSFSSDGSLRYMSYLESQEALLTIDATYSDNELYINQYDLPSGYINFDCLNRPTTSGYYTGFGNLNRFNNQVVFSGVVNNGTEFVKDGKTYVMTKELKKVGEECPGFVGYLVREVNLPQMNAPVFIKSN